MTRAAAVLLTLAAFVLALRWLGRTPEPLTVAWRESDDGVTFA